MFASLLTALASALPAQDATPAATPPAALAGSWSGAATRDGVVKLLELDFEVDEGVLATTLTQPYDGFSRFGFDFRYEGGWLRSELWGDMELLVDLDEDQLRGTIRSDDGDVTHTVFLQRVLDLPRPRWREEEIRFAAGDDVLAGALILPETPGPHPALVHVTGRGYGTRWETHAMATRLARYGVAGLVFDGRGSGNSTGNRATATDEQRFADVHAARDVLATRDDIRQHQVGLIGGSAGGWVVPIVAAERDDVAFLITTVGPAESLAEQQGHVIQELLKQAEQSFDDAELQAAYDYTVALVELSGRRAPWPEFEALMEPARSTRWWPLVDQPEDMSHPEVDYFMRRPGFDPVPALRQTRIPMLAIFGEDDWIVPPEHNVPKLRRWLTEAGNTDFEIVVFSGADHALGRPQAVVGEGDWPQRFERSWTRPPRLFETIIDWVLARVDVASH